jgi:hypothetical protein
MFINDLRDVINCSKYLPFAEGIKIYRVINYRKDCNLLHSAIDSVRGWCSANHIELSIGETKVISF